MSVDVVWIFLQPERASQDRDLHVILCGGSGAEGYGERETQQRFDQLHREKVTKLAI